EPVRPSTRFATLKGDELTTTAKRRSADASKVLHQLKGDLDWIVMKCLEKDRTRRYETANGLASDLLRHVNNEPVLARSPSNMYRIQKMVRRNKLAFAAAATISGTLVLGTLIYVQTVRSEERKTRTALADAQTNFRFARKAIQSLYGVQTPYGESSSVKNPQDEQEQRLDLFLEMYRKARATQPLDRELLVEYVHLLEAKS